MTDQYAWWRAALAKDDAPIHEGRPQCGYYFRKISKSGPTVAAAIWIDQSDTMVCRVGAEMVDPVTEWSFLAQNPIAERAATDWFAHGKWPSDKAREAIEEQPSNLPSDPGEACLVLIAAELEATREFLRPVIKTGITTEAQATRAGDKVGTLRALVSTAKKLHKAEKDPHLTAGRAVDLRYNPQIEKLDTAIKALKDLADAYLRAEDDRKRAEVRAAEAERQRIIAANATAEEAARIKAEKAAAAGKKPPTAAPKIELVPEVTVFEKTKIGGNTGRSLSLKSTQITTVTDHTLALAFFAHDPEVIELIAKLARQAVKAGHLVPGTITKTEEMAA